MRTTVILPVTMLLIGLTGCTAYGAQGYSSAPVYGAPSYRAGYEIQSVQQFYAPLAPYGQWVQTRWGLAFAPAVDRDWRPYTIGHWSDFGNERQWESDEPWGWATYHYGRWGYDNRVGWVWVPDTNWGPAWVAWRDGGDYSGWAPIPPGVSFSLNLGFSDWDYDRWYGPSWVFVSRQNLYRPGFGGGILPWQRGRDYWGSTRYGSQPQQARHDDHREDHPGRGQHVGDEHGNAQLGNAQHGNGPGQWRYNQDNRQPSQADDRNVRPLPPTGFDPRGRRDDPRQFDQNRAVDPRRNDRDNNSHDGRPGRDPNALDLNGRDPAGRGAGNFPPNNVVPNQRATSQNEDRAALRAPQDRGQQFQPQTGQPARQPQVQRQSQVEAQPQPQPQLQQYQAPAPRPTPPARPNERAPEPE